MAREKYDYGKNLKKRVNSVNTMIRNMEKRYGEDSQIVKRVYNTLNMALGTENATRYRVPEDASLRRLNMIERGLSLVENSAYATKEGRKKLRSKAFSSFMKNNSEYSEVQAEKLYDIFENSVNWDRMRELSQEYGSDHYTDPLTRAIDKGLSTFTIDRLMRNYMRSRDLGSKSPDANLQFWDYVDKYTATGKKRTIENRLRREERKLDALYKESEK